MEREREREVECVIECASVRWKENVVVVTHRSVVNQDTDQPHVDIPGINYR